MTFKPKCLATAVGSMPHADIEKALDVIFDCLPEAPIWPQLPSRDLNELMEIQYSEGMPCRVIDREKRRMYFDTSGDYSEAFAAFYEPYLTAMDPDDGDGDCSSMAISSEFAVGIGGLEERLKKMPVVPYVKVQTTGPCSFALTIVDENKRALYYNEEFRDMIVKALAMKCRWQIQKFKPYAKRVICFVDEPILSGFGSSTYVTVKRDDVVALIAEVVEAIHADGALAGVHCCGNTEWSILVDAGVDIINFDAFEFGETVEVYAEHIKKHIDAEKSLAFGIVPTSSKIREQSVAGLVGRYETLVESLARKTKLDETKIIEQTMITPSCGTGCLAVEEAELVFRLNRDLSRTLRDKYRLV